MKDDSRPLLCIVYTFILLIIVMLIVNGAYIAYICIYIEMLYIAFQKDWNSTQFKQQQQHFLLYWFFDRLI